MPNWAGQETGGERMGRWMASPCVDECTTPVEFQLTVDGQPGWEGFACAAHLALAVRAVGFRGHVAEVTYFGPVSLAERGEALIDASEPDDDEEPASDGQWAAALAKLDTSRCPYPLSDRMTTALATRDPETIREAGRWDLGDDDPDAPTLKAADWVFGELTRLWNEGAGQETP